MRFTEQLPHTVGLKFFATLDQLDQLHDPRAVLWHKIGAHCEQAEIVGGRSPGCGQQGDTVGA
jgi:hypothetical protein